MADFNREEIEGILHKLEKANLSGIDLTKADLHRARLSKADLHKTNLNMATIVDVDTIYNKYTKFPALFDPEAARMVLVE